ncbi:MAG TPA: ATP-binding protein [Methylobacter sp.]
MLQEGDTKFEHLHLMLDTGNGILSLLLALFLYAEQHDIDNNICQYLIIGFGLATFTEILHALVGIEWTGSLEWIQDYSNILRPATWPPSTYVLPLSIAWILWLEQRKITVHPRLFAVSMGIVTIVLFVLAWILPKYMDTGILGIQRPTQVPLLFLWLPIIAACWRVRDKHPLYEGIVWMGTMLFLSDLCMLYSTSPHEKFTMMAHSGKLLAYLLLHVIQMQAASADSHARRLAENDLRIASSAFESQEGMVITDMNTVIIKANKAFIRLSGYSSDELINRKMNILKSGFHNTKFYIAMWDSINHTDAWQGEIWNRVKNGDVHPQYITITAVKNKDGNITNYVATYTDISERRHLEQQLRQAQKMEALGQMTGGIAHDFNNILAAILGYSNLALERCVSDPSDKLARYLGEVISASERARDLIVKMLAYSRTSPTSETVPLDMVSEIEKTVAMLSVAIPAGIKVATHIEPYLPLVLIDPIDIQQALINLIVNSRDAIGDQGQIDITLERATITHKTCAICQSIIDGDYVALEVKDTGSGIPANIQQRIFDPFFTTKEVGKGSGLGLSMVQGIVIKNNAHLLIESSPDQGASFRLLFPFADTEAMTPVAPLSTAVAPLTKRWHIWAVEDQVPLAAYYQELLQEQGYRVTVFIDPTEALWAFRLDSDGVDLVITDQTMPYLSGSELACAMLAIKPELPIILITGYSERINADEAKRLGIRRYLNKPVDGKKLLGILAAELGSNDPVSKKDET